jgi:WD40 repeat protein/serine/threonine protein kinase
VGAAGWRIGDVISDLYEVRDEIKTGGMGRVYRVWHRGWRMELAVKVPKPDLLTSPVSMANFETEAQTWVELGLHPNVVSCVYVRRLDGLPRVFAEWVDGGTLAQAVSNRTLYKGSPDEALGRMIDVAIQFAWGLAHAHANGSIHQDVKPANTMLTADGIAKVTDFGLARARVAAGERDANRSPNVLASFSGGMTPAYCSPEQGEAVAAVDAGVEPQPLTRATDVWSWAISVLEMFFGEPPCLGGGQTAAEVLESFLSDGGRSDDPTIPPVPPGVGELLRRCFQLDPAARPSDMSAIADELIQLYATLLAQRYPRTRPTRADLLADGLNNQALSMLDLGRIDEAERLWQRAVAADPTHPHTVHNYGLYRWRRGEITDTELIAHMKAVLASHPDDADCKRLLAQVHLERCDTTIARMLLIEARGDAPDNTDIVAALAVAENYPELTRSRVLTHSAHVIWTVVVAVSANGRVALTGGQDHNVRAWNVSTGACISTLTGHASTVQSVACRADGNVAVSAAGQDNTVRIWDVVTGSCLHCLTGHTDSVTAVAMSADGRTVLSGSDDQTVRVWDALTGACLQTLSGHTKPVASVAVSFDGRTAISASADGTARVWDVPTANCRHILTGHTGGVTSVALNATGRIAASGGHDPAVRIWDLTTGASQRCLTGHTSTVNSLALSADGNLAVSGGDDLTMRIWDVPDGVCLHTLSGHTYAVESVAVSANGRVALSAGDWEGTARLWDVPRAAGYKSGWSYARPKSAQELLGVAAQVESAVQQADALLAAGHGPAAAAQLRRARDLPGHQRDPRLLTSWRQLAAIGRRGALTDAWVQHTLTGHTAVVWSVAVSADGRVAASGSLDKTLRVWDLASGTCRHTLTGHTDGVSSVALSADGRRALSSGHDKTLRVWDLDTGACLNVLPHPEIGAKIAVSADGRLAVSGSHDQTLRVWDLDAGACLHVLTGHNDWVNAVALSADGRIAVSGGRDATLRVWDIAGNQCLHSLTGHTGGLSSVALSADGRVALSSNLEEARVWEVPSGRCVQTLTNRTGGPSSVALSADGRIALSGHNDRAARVWDVASGQHLHTLTGYADRVESVALSGDAAVAVTPHVNTAIRVWALDWEYEFADEPAAQP